MVSAFQTWIIKKKCLRWQKHHSQGLKWLEQCNDPDLKQKSCFFKEMLLGATKVPLCALNHIFCIKFRSLYSYTNDYIVPIGYFLCATYFKTTYHCWNSFLIIASYLTLFGWTKVLIEKLFSGMINVKSMP